MSPFERPTLCPNCHKKPIGCSCHRRNNDPIHPELHHVVAFIDETKYFGAKAQDEVLKLVADVRAKSTRALVARKLDGFEKIRIDRDCDRLEARAKGKVFGTAQKMREREMASKGGPKRGVGEVLSNIERIQRHAALYTPPARGN